MGNSLSGASLFSPGWDSKLQGAHERRKTKKKQKENGQPSQGKSRKMRGSDKLPERGVEVRTSEREGKEGGVKKRKGTPLSLYYPSVTGLLGGCYGYGDSRLSVLLTIAHKGSIQLWATMQIPLSLSLTLFFSFFPSVYIVHLTYTSLHFPQTSHTLPRPTTTTVLCFYPTSHPPLFYTRPSHIPPSP